MPDREKYIEILSKTAKTVKEFNKDTPIKISLECIEDILELLKEQEDLGTELTNAVELIHKKNERIEKLLKEQEHKDRMFHALEDDWKRIKELLKEQEAVKPVRDEQTGRMWLCGKCGSYVGFEDNDPYDQNEFDKYCRECGRPILWEGR